MRFSVHPCINSIDCFFFFVCFFFVVVFFFQQNSYPFCVVVSDDVTKCVEVRHKKACKLLGINSLSFYSLVYLYSRVQTGFNQFLTL